MSINKHEVRPQLFIGLGGTGRDALLSLRRRMRMKLGKNWRVPCYGFLWIDTQDAMTSYSFGKQDFIDRDIAFDASEKIYATVDRQTVATFFEAPELNPRIFDWMASDANARGVGQIVTGAGQLRANGRLAFFHCYREIRDAISNKINIITAGSVKVAMQEFPFLLRQDSNVKVNMVFSIAGGTGAGMFLDTAMLVRDLANKISGGATIDNDCANAFVVMPDVFAADPEIRLTAASKRCIASNGYAALSEIEYYSFDPSGDRSDPNGRGNFRARWDPQTQAITHLKEPPFSCAYLIGRSNQSASGKNLDGVEDAVDLIGEYLFLDLDAPDIAGQIVNDFDNMFRQLTDAFVERVKDPKDEKRSLFERRHDVHYGSIGLAKAYTDAPRLRLAASYKLAAEMIEDWIGKPVDKPNRNREQQDATDFCAQQLLLSPAGLLEEVTAIWKSNQRSGLNKMGFDSSAQPIRELSEQVRRIMNQQDPQIRQWRHAIDENASKAKAALTETVKSRLQSSTISKVERFLDFVKAEIDALIPGLMDEGEGAGSGADLQRKLQSNLESVFDCCSRFEEAQSLTWPLHRQASQVCLDQARTASSKLIDSLTIFAVASFAKKSLVPILQKTCMELTDQVRGLKTILADTLNSGSDKAHVNSSRPPGLKTMYETLKHSRSSPRNVLLIDKIQGGIDVVIDRQTTEALERSNLISSEGDKRAPCFKEARQRVMTDLESNYNIQDVIGIVTCTNNMGTAVAVRDAAASSCFELLVEFMSDPKDSALAIIQREWGGIDQVVGSLIETAAPYARRHGVVASQLDTGEVKIVKASSADRELNKEVQSVVLSREMTYKSAENADSVFVAHGCAGFPLCSLDAVQNLWSQYQVQQEMQRVDVHHTHQDCGKFPRIVPEDQKTILKRVQALSLIVQALVLRLIKWDNEGQRYYYRYADNEFSSPRTDMLGQNLDQVVKNLQPEFNSEAMRSLSNELGHARSDAFEDLTRLALFRSSLEFCRNRLYPEKMRHGIDGTIIRTASIEHNVFKILREDLDRNMSERFEKDRKEEFKAINDRLRLDLDRFVEFVGPTDQPLLTITMHEDEKTARKALEYFAHLQQTDPIEAPVVKPLAPDNILADDAWKARVESYGVKKHSLGQTFGTPSTSKGAGTKSGSAEHLDGDDELGGEGATGELIG